MKSKSLYHCLGLACKKLNFDPIAIFEFLEAEGFPKNKLETIFSRKRNCHDQIPSLCWNNNFQINRREFLEAIRKTGVVRTMKAFELLFNDPTGNLKIRLDQKRVIFTIQLLAFLKESRLVCANNCLSFYQVFQYHAVNFDEVFLKNQEPGKRVDSVKKLRSWQKSTDLFKELFCKSL